MVELKVYDTIQQKINYIWSNYPKITVSARGLPVAIFQKEIVVLQQVVDKTCILTQYISHSASRVLQQR